MAHNHGYEYQIRIVYEDGSEKLCGWMNGAEQVAPAMSSVHEPRIKTCWLLVRNITCPDCSERTQVLEYPINDIPSPRCIPHDSSYLQRVDSKNRYALSFSQLRHMP
jgi:hypothetical protein